jgi:prepilin-type N-terminal cleavage/methylation domain-containing protein
MNQRGRIAWAGFTLVEIMIVVAIIGLLAAIALPSFVKARATSQAKTCINNLRQIDSAGNQWAIEKNHRTGDTYTVDDITPYIRLNSSGELPMCPSGGTYDVNSWYVGHTPRCTLATLNPPHDLPDRYPTPP